MANTQTINWSIFFKLDLCLYQARFLDHTYGKTDIVLNKNYPLWTICVSQKQSLNSFIFYNLLFQFPKEVEHK